MRLQATPEMIKMRQEIEPYLDKTKMGVHFLPGTPEEIKKIWKKLYQKRREMKEKYYALM